MFITIVIFIAVLAVLVLVHEFGHFIVAKKSGMVVEEFGFGFPPRLFGIQKVNGKRKVIWGHPKSTSDIKKDGEEETIYSINLFPLGGFVRIMGENNENQEDARSFVNRSFWGRFFTLIAGVFMNVLLAWVLISVGLVFGLPAAMDSMIDMPQGAKFKDAKFTITELQDGFPAKESGLKVGDVLLSLDGKVFSSTDEARSYILANAGKEFVFKVMRQTHEMEIKVLSRANLKEGEGPTGIVLLNIGKLVLPPHLAVWEGAKSTGRNIQSIFSGLYQVATSGLGLKALGGPVKIAKLTGEVADMGFVYLLQFASFLSLNLAVLNIMPFPALDGGRLLFLVIEKIRGKKNNPVFEQYANALGFALLLLLMVLVTIQDVRS